jgi:hypothetical protein
VASVAGALRRKILTPGVSATRLDVRGFTEKDPASKELLETVGRIFLHGYALAAEASRPRDAEAGLEEVPTRFRGFAYEGAGMGFAVRDGLPGGRRDHTARFLEGRADAHVYMVYVGIGWAMARLPKFRWPDSRTLDPLMVPLALDGYGFHQAYFKTDRYIRQQYREETFPWPAGPDAAYSPRAIDQGIGRAMWFVNGTHPARCADMIDSFPAARRADLYSGAGLAATYAGGVTTAELELFWDRAGEHRAGVAQASVFAAEARVRAGLVVPHTALATEVFCGCSPDEAAAMSLAARPDRSEGALPAYEVWRQRVAAEFVSSGRC